MIELTRPEALLLALLGIPVVWAWRASRQALPRGRARLSLAVRLLLLLLLVLALAGLRLTAPADHLSVVFVVDRSLSLGPESREWESRWLAQALTGAGPRDQYGVVVFGRDAVVERSVGPADGRGSNRLTSVVDPQVTDLAGALRLSQATFPADSSRRIVVLSDGRPTAGEALTEARLAAAQGTEVWAATSPAGPGREVLLQSVEVPRQPALGQPFDVRVAVRADHQQEALLVLTAADREIGRRRVHLRPGLNVFLVPQRLDQGGAVRYEARIQAEADQHAGNNRAGAVALVRGRPRMLFVTAEGAPSGPLPGLLRRQGFEVRVTGTGALPRSAAEYAGYSTVVFSDVSALQIPETQMETIRGMVTQAGLGFAMLGGPSSFGAGGWFRTPIEAVLPVDMDIRKARRGAVLALALVLDKSGSMAEAEGPVTRLAMAREAALAAASLLTRHDCLGAVAFDSAARWVVPMAPYDNPGRAAEELATLEAGGGTDLYPALAQALRALEGVQVPLKHAIILSDGRTEPGDFDALAARARAGRITLTTVAVGTDADLNFLRDLAEKTEGRSYLANQAVMLPRIFTRETVLASRLAFSEEPFKARPGVSHAVRRGLQVEQAPALLGHNLSTLRPAPAQAVLQTPEGDPLLAVGRAGLGRTVAWTSDGGVRWANPWVESGQLASLLAQALRWAASQGQAAGFEVQVEEGPSGAPKVVVEAQDLESPLALSGRALGPDGRARELDLVQTGPGRLEADLDAAEPGPWLVQVTEPESGLAAVTTWYVPYAPELARLGPDPAFTAHLASAGAGRAEPPPGTVFQPPARPLPVSREVWTWLLTLALLLLPLDVALRRVFLPEGWWERWRLRRRPSASPQPGADPTLRALLRRKQDLHPTDASAPPPPVGTPPAAPPLPAEPPAAPPPTSPAPPPTAPAEGTLARLRQVRDRTRDEQG